MKERVKFVLEWRSLARFAAESPWEHVERIDKDGWGFVDSGARAYGFFTRRTR